MRIPGLIRRLIVRVVLGEIVIGGHCGCCGAWVADRLVEVGWRVTLCGRCVSKSPEQMVEGIVESRAGGVPLKEDG